MTVVPADLSEERTAGVAADIVAAGGTARTVPTDVADLDAVEVAFDEVGDVRWWPTTPGSSTWARGAFR